MYDWVKVQSSVIASVCYAHTMLYIRFNSGATYAYYNVPEDVYTSLLAASSKGEFYNQYIRDRYPYHLL